MRTVICIRTWAILLKLKYGKNPSAFWTNEKQLGNYEKTFYNERQLKYSSLTFWLLREDPLDPSRYVYVVSSYLLIFFGERHLCKSLILWNLFLHLFGLIFQCPTSERMSDPSVVLRWDFLKHWFFEK